MLRNLHKVEKIAKGSKIYRLVINPYRYIRMLIYRQLNFFFKNEKLLCTDLFFKQKMWISLPSATDIYLTGGKSHDSEIRLAKFIILHLKNNNNFWDIGAHYGYYSLLASHLIGDKGRVLSFEPAVSNFNILKMNANIKNNIKAEQKAVSDSPGILDFYEFPNLYSEYNSSNIKQFAKENWFLHFKPKKIKVIATSLDNIFQQEEFCPDIIKVDVEGGEYKVVKGAIGLLNEQNPFFIMEYLNATRHNVEHKKAVNLLRESNYTSFYINGDGGLVEVYDLDNYLKSQNIDSDNIVFKKKLDSK